MSVEKTSEKTIDANWLIGALLEKHPEAIPVFIEHFGEGCFTCPGAKLETIAFGSTMHGLDVDFIVGRINDCIAAGKDE
jgi:hybrid cluster-associated redox disulfide protein